MEALKCPITCEIFTDPVTAEDGHTYERDAITNWLKQNPTSPLTREPMSLNSLRPNYIVKKMLEEFQSSMVKKHYHFELNVDIRKTKNRPIFQAPGKTIYEAEWISRTGPSIVLLKIDGAKARREAEFYVQLGCHPHIVRTYGMLESEPNTLTLVQEFASEGDLYELLREKHFHPSPSVLLEIFIQIADAMVCLADNNIIHGDLACRNVLVFRMDNFDPKGNLVKLTDFGLTRASTLYTVTSNFASATAIVIPVRYAAPEILQNDDKSNYTEQSDVYSMGVLMWEAYSSGQMPYASIDSDIDVRQLKLQGDLLNQPDNCDQILWNIITHCLQQQPSARPTFKILKQSLLDLQFQQRFNLTSITNNEQTSSKDCVSKGGELGYQYDNEIDDEEIAYGQEPQYYEDDDDEFYCQQSEYCEHQTEEGETDDEDNDESSYQQEPQYYEHQSAENETDDEEIVYNQEPQYNEDDDDDNDESSHHQEPQYYEHQSAENETDDEEIVYNQEPQYNEDDDDDDNDESSYHQEPQYYEHQIAENETDDEEIVNNQEPQYYEDDNEDEETSIHQQSNYYEYETNEGENYNEEPIYYQPSQQYYQQNTYHDDEDDDDDVSSEQEEASYQFKSIYYHHESTDDEDDDDDNNDFVKGFSFQIQTQEFYYIVRN